MWKPIAAHQPSLGCPKRSNACGAPPRGPWRPIAACGLPVHLEGGAGALGRLGGWAGAVVPVSPPGEMMAVLRVVGCGGAAGCFLSLSRYWERPVTTGDKTADLGLSRAVHLEGGAGAWGALEHAGDREQ